MGCWKLLQMGIEMDRRAVNGCRVKLNGYWEFWAINACFCADPNTRPLQSSGESPALDRITFFWLHASKLELAPNCALVMMGSRFLNRWVNPDHPADRLNDGPYD